MLDNIYGLEIYKTLPINKSSNAYLFYSSDKNLNNMLALAYAKAVLCGGATACNTCSNCKQFEANSHPDFFKVEQDSFKVEDAERIISKLSTLPISAKQKVFVILNAESMNETSQNKLLKSFEEANHNNIFILSCSKTDKLLPTILSRFTKIYVGKLNNNDKLSLATSFKKQNIDIFNYINKDITLTEMLNLTTNQNYLDTLEFIKYIIIDLKTSRDIPRVANKNMKYDKSIFFQLLQNVFLDSLNNGYIYDKQLTEYIKDNYSKTAMVKILKLIEDSYTKQLSNVNFGYLLDNLLFNMLKEKFLCK